MTHAAKLIPAAFAVALSAQAATVEDTIKALDTAYQKAVLHQDIQTMDQILADDFILVLGEGTVFTKAELLARTASKGLRFERQESSQQTVRVWGDTAVITALLWEKGTRDGKPFDMKLWFSDVYVKTPQGWRYAFGQAAQPLAP